MRHISSFLLIVLCSSIINGQSDAEAEFYSISHRDWSNALIFKYSPQPLVTGYGILSDSLKEVHGSVFYELNGEYMAIETWADYYYWFTQRYEVLFRQSSALYSTYYFLNDIKGMIRYVFFDQNYKGDYFPSAIRIQFENDKQFRRVQSYNRVMAYRGIPYFDQLGMYRPDLVERRIESWSASKEGHFSITSGRRVQTGNEGSTAKVDEN